MHTLMNSAAAWVADMLDTLLDDAMIGFGNAAPLIAGGDHDSPIEVPGRRVP